MKGLEAVSSSELVFTDLPELKKKTKAQNIMVLRDEYKNAIDSILDDDVYDEELKSSSSSSVPSLTRLPAVMDSSPQAKNDGLNDDGDLTKDSEIAKFLKDILQDKLCFDDVSNDWYLQQSGLWKPISKRRALGIIDKVLPIALPSGYAMSKINSVESFLTIKMLLKEWESDRNLLPLKNGVLNIVTRKLIPYSHKHKFNWQLPYNYDPDAKINIIAEWLSDATGNDQEAISIIRAFFRMALVGGEVQKFLELIGPGGTGKSTLIRLFEAFIGKENTYATDLKNLEENKFEAASLYGKKLAIIGDSARYSGEVSVLKRATGGDPLRYEKKNQQQGESFVFTGVFVIAANEPIRTSDYTSGLIRRRMPVTFTRKVTDEDKEKWASFGGIEAAMRSELPGLLNWVLDMDDAGIKRIISSINGGMTQTQREHLVNTNPIAGWLDERVVIKSDAVSYIGVSTAKEPDPNKRRELIDEKLYSNYENWCIERNTHPVAHNRFTDNLIDVCEQLKITVKKGKNKKGSHVTGLTIRKDSHYQYKSPITNTLISDELMPTSDEPMMSQTLDNDSGDELDDLFIDSDKEVI